MVDLKSENFLVAGGIEGLIKELNYIQNTNTIHTADQVVLSMKGSPKEGVSF